jgi:hypothetical protein
MWLSFGASRWEVGRQLMLKPGLRQAMLPTITQMRFFPTLQPYRADVQCHRSRFYTGDDDGGDSGRSVHLASCKVPTNNHVSHLCDDNAGDNKVGGDIYGCNARWDASFTAG